MNIKIKNLLSIVLFTMLLFFLFQEKVFSQSDPKNQKNRRGEECPKYTILKKTIIRSSKTGLLYESDWKQDIAWNICKPQTLGDLPPQCSSYIIPGVSLGDKDNIITTCIYKKVVNSIDPNLNKKKCEVKIQPVITSVPFPNIVNLINKIRSEGQFGRMQTDLNVKMQGMVKKKSGEECCYPDPYEAPQKYEELTGSVTPAINAKVSVPSFTWNLYSIMWQGVIMVNAEIKYYQTGQNIQCNSSASITGKSYPNALCKPCISKTLSGNCYAAVYMKGFGKAPVLKFNLWGWSQVGFSEITGYAKLGSSISFSGKVVQCPVEQTHGTFSHTELKGDATARFTLMGKTIELSQSISLAPSFSKSF